MYGIASICVVPRCYQMMKKLLQQDDKNYDDGDDGGGWVVVVVVMMMMMMLMIMKTLLGNFRFLFSENLHFKSRERETRLLKVKIVGF